MDSKIDPGSECECAWLFVSMLALWWTADLSSVPHLLPNDSPPVAQNWIKQGYKKDNMN